MSHTKVAAPKLTRSARSRRVTHCAIEACEPRRLMSATPVSQLTAPRLIGPVLINDVLVVRQPLTVPTSLAVKGVTDGAVKLSWSDSDTTVIGFNLFRATPDSGFALLAQLTDPQALTYTDSSVSSNTAYQYEVQAVYQPGTSMVSAPVSALTPLSAPSGLAAAAQGSSSVSLTWTANDASATGYVIFRSTGGGFSQVGAVSGGQVNAFVDSSVSSGAQYAYEVEATAATNRSALSSPSSATTALVAPTGIAATATGGSTAAVTWANADAGTTGYYVFRSANGGTFAKVATLSGVGNASFSDAGLSSATSYSYEVESFNAISASALSSASSAITTLGAPTGLSANASSASVNLSWSNSDSRVTGFNVLRSTGGSSTFAQVGQLTGSQALSFADASVSSNTSYQYEIQAVYASGYTVTSSPASTLTLLSAPSGLAAAAQGSGSVSLTWAANDVAATGYAIFRSASGSSSFSQVGTVSGGQTHAFVDSTVSSGTGYAYRVEATTSANVSSLSASSSATTALVAPTGIAATATGASTATITWSNADAGTTGYYVFRSANGGAFASIATLSGIASTTFSDTGLSSGASYSYEVESFNAISASALSSASSATTTLNAPTGLSAAASSASVNLSWANSDSRVTGFKVLRSTGSGFAQVGTVTGAQSLSFTDSSVSSNTSYQYEVQAVYASGYTMTSASTSTLTQLSAPSGLAAAAQGTSSISLAWVANDPTATGYAIFRSTGGSSSFSQVGTVSGAQTNAFVDSAVSSGTQYAYEVEATTSGNTSVLSSSSSATTALVAPTGIAATATGASTATITWSNSDAGTTGYYVFRSANGGAFAKVATLSGIGSATFSDTSLTTANTYAYEVESFSSISASALSSASSAIAVLHAPTGLAAAATSGSVSLTWSNSDSAVTGFKVLRSTGSGFAQVGTVTGSQSLSFTDSSVSSNTSYQYEIQAVYASGYTMTSSPASTLTQLSAPSGLAAAAQGTSSVSLTWTANDASATGYAIFRSAGGAYAQVGTVSGGQTHAFTDSTVSSGTQYAYEVEATTSGNTSVLSSSSSATTALVAPTGIAATATGGSTATITWSNSDAGTAGYYVFRSVNGGAFANIATLSGTGSTTFSDSGLSSANTYSYEVQSFNAVTTSALSSASSATATLNAPTGLAATATSASVGLTWSNSDSRVTGFKVLRSTGSGFAQVGTVTGAQSLSFTDSSVSSNTSYQYEVQAVYASGYTMTTAATSTLTQLSAPSGLAAAAQGSGSISLAWVANDPTASGYAIFRSTGGAFSQVGTVSGSQTHAFTDSTASSGTRYTYEVEATTFANVSALSAPSSATTALVAPTGIAATATGATTATITWSNADAGTTGYYVFRSANGGAFASIATLSGIASTTFSDTGLSSGASYSYEVESFNAISASALSSASSATTTLNAPTGLSAAASSASVNLSWANSDSRVTGFKVLRSTGSGFAQVGTVTGAQSLSFTDSSVSSNTSYQYEVQAVYASGYTMTSASTSTLTQLSAPSGLAAAAQGTSSISLAWVANDPTATGYAIFRSTGGSSSFSQVGTVSGAQTNAFVDSAVSSGTQYAYEVEATTSGNTSVLSSSSSATTALVAPTGIAATATGASTATITWSNSDAGTTGYYVFRSANGGAFAKVATLSGIGSATFSDTGLSSATSYSYEVQSFNSAATSALSSASSVTTTLNAPTGVAASASSSSVSLSWNNSDSAATGYAVLRSTNGTSYSSIATIGSAATTTYSDSSVVAGTTYYYAVQATKSSISSAASASVSIIAANSASTVAVATRYSNELVVTSTGAADSISVTQANGVLSIFANGQTITQAVPSAGLFIYARGGTDSITLASSVTVRTTVESVDGAATAVTSAAPNLSAWIDSADVFSGTGVVHSIASFVGGVSKALGAALPNPTDSGTTKKVTAQSLWGTGPLAADINQGGTGDCYFLCSLAAFANQKSSTLRESAVDMGDGTYVVQYMKGSALTYYRVSNDFATGPYSGGFMNSYYGASGSIWGMVLEKAFAYARTGANTYSSLNSGWMSEAYDVLGTPSNYFFPSSSDASLAATLSAATAAGKVITFATSNSPTLVQSHAYTFVSVTVDAGGVGHYLVRNPWGVKGDSLEDAHGYATLTYAQMVANFYAGQISNA